MKSLTEIIVFLEDVLGKTAASVFDDNMEEMVYFIRSEALTNLEITESKMRSRLRKLSETILAASVKRFLNENYADDYGYVELNVEGQDVYDRNIRPISQIETIRKSQREIMSLMVSRGMYEFAKGRHLARIMETRSNENNSMPEPSPKDTNWALGDHKDKRMFKTKRPSTKSKTTMLEQVEVQILRLERLLPNISKEDGKLLSKLYAKLKAERK